MTTPIATVEDYKLYKGISTTNQDPLIQMLLDTCLPAIGNFCNRKFEYRSGVVEYRDGNDRARMILANYPIVRVTSLVIDGRSIPESVNGSAGYKYIVGGRYLILSGYSFTKGDRNIEITVDAGYGDASGPANADINPWPKDLKLALLMVVATRIGERDRLGIGSKTLAGESITYDAGSGTSAKSEGVPANASSILAQYLNTVPESGL